MSIHPFKMLIVLALIFSCHFAIAQSLTPDKVIDLSPWKLCIPVDANGGTVGAATYQLTPALVAGYHSQYFYANADTSISFWCPVNGATTTPGVGSDHPRTELQEVYIWNINDGGTLTATMAINQYPPVVKEIIIGQIHGGNVYSADPFVMLMLNEGNLLAYVKGVPVGNAGTIHDTLLKNVPLNTKLHYSIGTDGDSIYFTSSCSGATGTGSWIAPVPSAWAGLTVRFAAGDYVQDTGASSSLGGKVTFYQLDTSHFVKPVAAQDIQSNVRETLLIYPDPVQDVLTATLPGHSANGLLVMIINSAGKAVAQQTCNKGQVRFDVHTLKPGTYVISVHTKEGRELIQQFVKW